MKTGSLVIMTGIIIVIFGTIFHLQGQSIVGPQSSFMYSNPDWITYGIQITIIGICVVGSGIIIKILKKS